MSTLIQCQKVSHSAGIKPLFNGLDLTIASSERKPFRAGLVGHNGCGKSSLLALLSGSQQPDAGEINFSNSLHLESVEQFIDPSLAELTLKDAIAEKIPGLERTFREYEVNILLEQLAFGPHEFSHLVKDLSGGQQNRLMFARALVNKPNLILFDEPTNHLDLQTMLVFEDYLKNRLEAGFMVISHDREFLDSVTNQTLFLRDERLYRFDLPFSAAREKLIEQDMAAEATRKDEEKSIKRLKASAKRLATWGKVYDNEDLARKAKTMEKRISKLEENKTFVSRGSDLKLTLSVSKSRANRMIQMENQSIYPPGGSGDALFNIEDFFIRPGERVALLGKNGVGKTTLIKIVIDQYANGEGVSESQLVKFNPQCQIGYYDQELQNLDPAASLLDSLRQHCDNNEETYKSSLIHSGFPYQELDKKTGVLSGGEKARLMFLIIRLNEPNFLILDEPTNHIDIQGKEELENEILISGATALVTSHDRRFVDNICNRFLLIEAGQLREIQDPGEFYHSTDMRQQAETTLKDDGLLNRPGSEEEILQRIVELESKLDADLNRKTRHQKPESQLRWRQEILHLTELL
jgi:ATPase subunit of ABC transporter with duplicated ATPase domains